MDVLQKIKEHKKRQPPPKKRSGNLLIPRINKSLEDSNKSTYKAAPSFTPSTLGSPCLRRIYYAYHRVEMDYPFDSKMLKIFGLGNSIHELMQGWLEACPDIEYIPYVGKNGNIPIHFYTKKEDPEFPVKSAPLEIRKGKIDGILKIDEKFYILEMKSINNRGFLQLSGPKEDHSQQASLYFYLFSEGLARGDYDHVPGVARNTPVEGIIYLYMNKDTGDLKEYLVDKNSILLERSMGTVANKIFAVQDYNAKNELPPMTEDWCKTCNYRDKCARSYKPE